VSVKQHPTKGPGWWQIRISRGRRKPMENYTFRGLEAEARAFEAELYGRPADDGSARVVDHSAAYFDWYALHKAKTSDQANRYAFKHLLRLLGTKHIGLLRPYDYDQYKTARLADGVTRKTINNELICLSAYLTWCAEQKRITIGARPKLFPKSQVRPQQPTIPLTADEVARLLDQLDTDKKTIVQLYSLCGLRRTEALNLTVQNIDLDTNLITVTGKGNKTRIVPIISDNLKQGLATAIDTKITDPKTGEQRNKKQTDHLFISPRTGRPYRDIKKGLKAAAARAGIKKKIGNHLLRHSFGTSAVTAGVNLRSLQAMLGHSDIRMTEIYTTMSAQILHAEAAKLNNMHQASAMSANKNKKKEDDNG
jgi:integrase/recombinase XerD